ncbi:hypothetical protein CKO42_00160 [Lamprobacter modestohalophilus]|uniref:Uncharacterized protein n=1 Tax=Lamprobacter modestohalophilus TaxID=1064514 RepID=A0A9X1B251_9GAMM|nr:hypothetical protein [Lamprobacter modestohalophilus]MBK1616890.1 hypothetical protein [Lamprobacter modestohalophilus]
MLRRTGIELLIYYGEFAYDFKQGGIEAQYERLLNMEQSIKDTLAASETLRYQWLETVLDENHVPGYKLVCPPGQGDVLT